MALKGKTTFELTDVNTGEVEVIEDSNMVTNGLQDFLMTYGYFGCDVMHNDIFGANSLWVKGLGGLFLFDTRLDEDVNNTFVPAGVKMVGNGSKDVSNSGAVTELGSYNTSESGLQADGSIKLVFDFSTQQANGSIACACLTSKFGGYIGVGNESGYIHNSDYDFKEFKSDNNHECTSGIDGGSRDLNHFLYPVYNENAMYFANPYNITYSDSYANQHWSVTKKIQILKVRAGFSSLSIKDKNALGNIVETYDIDIPQDILGYMSTSKSYVYTYSDIDGNVYVAFCRSASGTNPYTNYFSVSNGSYFWIMKIGRDLNVSAYKLTNNVGKKIYLSRKTVAFDGDYIFLYTGESPYTLYGIKYSDSTQIIETGVSVSSRYHLFVEGRNLIGICDSYVNNQLYYKPHTIYDVVSRTRKMTNGYFEKDSDFLIPFIDKKGLYLLMEVGNSSDFPIYYTVMKDPRYLATINNLSEPVVKTASKTMKVTYTITEA